MNSTIEALERGSISDLVMAKQLMTSFDFTIPASVGLAITPQQPSRTSDARKLERVPSGAE